MSILKATAAIGTLILLAATNAHAWDQKQNTPKTSSLAYSGSVGAVNGFSSNVGPGVEATAAQSKSAGRGEAVPNSAASGTSQEGTAFSFGLGRGAGSSSFTASSYGFGAEFRGNH